MTSKSAAAKAREQRLAAKLRENLKRRKQQARARQDGDAEAAAGEEAGAADPEADRNG